MKNFFDKKKKMGGYKGGNRFGGGGGGSRGGWQRDDARSSRPTMYRATCDQCRAACEVPFQPTGQRPVYCRDCFRSNDGGSSFQRPPQRPSFFEKKPSFHSAPRPSTSNNDEVVRELRALNKKMDQLLEALSGFEVAVEGEEHQDQNDGDLEDVSFTDEE